MTGLEACSQIVDLRDEVLPEFAICVVGAIKPDGRPAYTFQAFGRPDAAIAIGVLEMVKMDIHLKTRGVEEYGD